MADNKSDNTKTSVSEPRKRGRKPGSKNAPKTQQKQKKEAEVKTETTLSQKKNELVKEKTNDNLTLNERLNKVISEIKTSSDGLIVMDDGKTYTKVSERVKQFRKEFGFDMKLITVIKELNRETVVVEAQFSIFKDNRWELVQTASAFEDRSVGHINKTSYIEIAETSAVGRCLGFLGAFGDEFASVEEIFNHEANKNSSKKTISGNVKRSSASLPTKEAITSEQLDKINNFINSSKDYTLHDLLDGKKDISGKKATKLEDLSKEDANLIISIMNDFEEDSPL